MKVSQSEGRLMITVLDGDSLQVYELKEDLWREFEFLKIQLLGLPTPIIHWSFFSTGFENYIILISKTVVKIFIQNGVFYESLISVNVDGTLSQFDNFLALNIQSCRNEVVFIAGSGSTAVLYVLNWSVLPPVLQKVHVYTIEVHIPNWILAFGYTIGDQLRFVIPGQDVPAIYAIRAHLEEVEDPVLQESLALNDVIQSLKTEYNRQASIMERAEERLSKSVDTNFNISGNITIIQSLYIYKNFVTNILVANKITFSGTDLAGGVNSGDYTAFLAQLNDTQKRVNSTLAKLDDLESRINDIQQQGGVDQTIRGYTTIINPSLNLQSLIVNNINIGRTLDVNGSPVSLTNILNGIVRANTGTTITGKKTFSNGLEVGELRIDFLDDIPVSDLVTVRDEQTISGAIYQSVFNANQIILKSGATIAGKDFNQVVQLDTDVELGRVIFENLKVEANIQVISSIVNDIDISRFFQNALLLSGGTLAGSLAFTNDLLVSNLESTNIMGIDTLAFINNTVFKDRDASFNGKLTVAGPIVVRSLQVLGTINEKRFPDNYPIKNDTGPIIFRGSKHFSHVKFGNLKFGPQAIVDGLNPNTLVTKSTDQLITASKIFRQGIHVEGNLNIPSKIIDRVNLDDLIRSQTHLPSTDPWVFDVVFTGSVTVPKLVYSRLLNGLRFSALANDFLYDDGLAQLSGVKTFAAGLSVGNAQIIGTLNGEDIHSLVTTTKNHVISGSKTFVQDITFTTLNATIIDGEDLALLFKSILVSDGEGHIISGKKVFTDSVFINSLEIKGRLSGVDFSKVLTKSGNQRFSELQIFNSATFSSLQVQSIKLSDGFTVNGIDLSVLASRRVSLKSRINHTGRLIIDGPFIVVGNLMADKINGINIQELQENLVTDNTNSTIAGPVTISNLVVSDSVHSFETRGANGLSLKDIANKAVKLSGTNVFTGTPMFNELELRGDIVVRGLVNGVDLRALGEDAVYTNLGTSQQVFGTKIFLNGFEVKGDINTDTTNGVDLSTRLFTLHSDQHISSFYGFENVVVKGNVHLIGLFNDLDLRSLHSTLKPQSTYASVNFLGNVKVGEVIIAGTLDGVNITSHLLDAVKRGETEAFITGKKTFSGNTQFSNLKVNVLNSVSFNDYVANVILRNGNKVITTLLTINGDVSAPSITAENIIVEGTIDGVDYKSLKRNVIYLSRQQNIVTELIFESSITVRGNINAVLLNGLSIAEDYLTIRTEQVITVNASLATISSTFVDVGGTINNIYLPLLKELTMQAVGGQVLSGLTVIKGSVKVLGNVEVSGKTGTDVQIKLLSEVIDLQKGGDIRGFLRFTRELTTTTLQSTSYLINNVNILELYNKAWFTDVATVISARLIFRSTVTFKLGITITGTVDRLNIASLYNQTSLILKQFGASTTEIREEYASMCNSVVNLYEQLQDSLYEGDCFEFVYAERFPHLRHSSITFSAFDKTYLLLSYEGQCYSEVYVWNRFTRSFNILFSLATTGYVHEWVHVVTPDERVYIAAAASYSHNTCKDTNSTIWEVTSDSIKVARVLVPGEKVSKQVSLTKTFIHIHATHNTISYEYRLHQAQWVDVYTSEPFEFALHILDENGRDISFRSNGGVGEVWKGNVAKQTINLGYAIHDAVLTSHHHKIILFVLVDTYNPKGHSYELRVYEIYYGSLIWLDSAILETPGKITVFFVGNDACGSIYIAITQEHLYPVIFNFFSETLTEWNQMIVPRTTWIQYFGVPNNRFPQILDHYIIFGRIDRSALIYALLMRGSTVPKIGYSCEIEAFKNPLLKPIVLI
ncbi:hypothetical protein SK128_028331 [Halocaridina rubra]|uniref:Uncharacterized protein n=1 Tax=Halocaridina rubra TaxID=373956 RepID=A0AAN8W8S5_HALRR